MSENNSGWESYDDLIGTDGGDENAVGDHIGILEDVLIDKWEDGRTRYKGIVRLITAGERRADFTLSDRKSREATKRELEDAPPAIRAGMKMGLRMHEELYKFYKVRVNELEKGMKLGVKTFLTKRDPITKKGGFLRIAAFKPLSEIHVDTPEDTGRGVGF